jgi:hypothetical protein
VCAVPLSSSGGLWARYSGSDRTALTAILAMIALALLIGAFRVRGSFRPPAVGRSGLVTLLTLWPLSIVAFLVAATIYVAQFRHDYPTFSAPQSPILPVTLSAAALTFLVLAYAWRGRDRARLVGPTMAALAAPMVFELPFDLIVMGRTTPPVMPHPGLWRMLFFTPLFIVELCTIALLLAVPGIRLTRWTWAALAAQFLVFTWWASIGFGYPDQPLPHVANVIAKLCAFAVVWTMLLPPPKVVVDPHDLA